MYVLTQRKHLYACLKVFVAMVELLLMLIQPVRLFSLICIFGATCSVFAQSKSARAEKSIVVFNDVLRGSSNVGETGGWVQSAYMPNHLTAALDRNWQTWELPANQSDYYVTNASFLKCDNITLGYSFNNLFKGGIYNGVNGRVYATCNNVFTITNYDGLDPEIGNGVDQNMYPRPISFIVGLNLNF